MNRRIITLVAFLSILVAKAQDMSNSIEYNHLYIVGAAISAGWSDTEAPEMSLINDGVFEWTGELKGNEEFKFLNNRSWYKNILSAAPDVIVELGKNYNLDFYAAWDLKGKDWKFRLEETGVYTVLVDLKNMKMSISKAIETISTPDKLYVTGTALDNQIVELNDMYGAEFKNTISCKPGNILIINTPDIRESTIYYGPIYEDVDIAFGKGFSAAIHPVDKESRGWSVASIGDYTLYVGIPNLNYQGQKYVPRKVLYLVGGCCELNWNYWDESNKRFFPNPDNPEEMIWEGELRIGTQEEPKHFKILTAESWFEDTYHPYIKDLSADGVTDARISGGDDLKWTIEKDGNYRLTLNTKTEKLKVEYFDNNNVLQFETGSNTAALESVQSHTAQAYVIGHQIIVDSDKNTTVSIYDLTGKTITHKPNHTTGAVASDINAGIYLVSIDNQVKKLIVN